MRAAWFCLLGFVLVAGAPAYGQLISDGGFDFSTGLAPNVDEAVGAWYMSPTYPESLPTQATIANKPGTSDPALRILSYDSATRASVDQILGTPHSSGVQIIEFEHTFDADTSYAGGIDFITMDGAFSSRAITFGPRNYSTRGREWQFWGVNTAADRYVGTWEYGETYQIKVVTDIDARTYDAYIKGGTTSPRWVQLVNGMTFRHGAAATEVDRISFGNFVSCDSYIDNVAEGSAFAAQPLGSLISDDFDSYTAGAVTDQDGWRIITGDAASAQVVADGDGNVLALAGTESASDKTAATLDFDKVVAEGYVKTSFDVMWDGAEEAPTPFLYSLGGGYSDWKYLTAVVGVSDGRFVAQYGGGSESSSMTVLSPASAEANTWYTVETTVALSGDEENCYQLVVRDRDSGTVVWDTGAEGLAPTFRSYDAEVLRAVWHTETPTTAGSTYIDNFQASMVDTAPQLAPAAGSGTRREMNFDSYAVGNVLDQSGWAIVEGDGAQMQVVADPSGTGNVLSLAGTPDNDNRSALVWDFDRLEEADQATVSFDVMIQGETNVDFFQFGLGDRRMALPHWDFMTSTFGFNGEKFVASDGEDTGLGTWNESEDSYQLDTWYTFEATLNLDGDDDNTYTVTVRDRDTGDVVWDTTSALELTYRTYDLENMRMVLFVRGEADALLLDNFEYELIEDDLPGDLNGDGFVGGDDLDIVRSFWGQTVEEGNLLKGDPSGDGFVGGDDLDVVRANWGQGAPPSPGVVPEPSLITLLAGGLLAFVFRRR